MLEAYLVIFLLLSLLMLFFNDGASSKTVIYYSTIIAISIPLALRTEYSGYDTYTYFTAFESLDGSNLSIFSSYKLFMNSFTDPVELLYFFLNYSLSILFTNFNIVLFVFLIIGFIYLLPFYRSFSENYLLAVLFLFSSLTYVFLFGNAIRQGLAAGFIFYGLFKYYKNKKPISFLFFILIASGFHTSSLIFMTFPLIKKLRISALLGIIMVLIILGYTGLLKGLIVYIPNAYILNKLTNYFEGNNSPSIFNFSFISFFLFSSILYVKTKFTMDILSYKREIFLLKCYIFIFIFECILINSSSAGMRIAQYRFLIEPIILSNAVYIFKEKDRKLLLYVCFLLNSLYFTYVFVNDSVQTTLAGEM